MEAVEHAALKFDWLPGHEVHDDVLEEMSSLFSEHYGRWSSTHPEGHSGAVKFSPRRVRRLLEHAEARAALARSSAGDLIAYAIAIQGEIEVDKTISWVTQLVVHRAWRDQGVAKRVLGSIWGFSDHFAWGLVSANPFAVRALEKATRRRCDPEVIEPNAQALYEFGLRFVPYLRHAPDVGSDRSRIDTEFFVDHSTLADKVARAARNVPWMLGGLEEGWEWYAFTFREQKVLSLAAKELDAILLDGDRVVREAYSRMTLDPAQHKWMRHAPHEIDVVIEELGLRAGMSVLDLGCGQGRHSIELARRGMRVVGVDFLPSVIEAARAAAESAGVASDVEFHCSDARDVRLGRSFDAAICLYDVVGSFPYEEDNQAILRTLAEHLPQGAPVLASVMNFEVTRQQARRVASVADEPDQLLQLPPSSTMQDTGQIFDPNYYLLDPVTKLVYRKEQFDRGLGLPAELIVRDRRYTVDELPLLLEGAGVSCEWVRPVRLGAWRDALEPEHPKAMELLMKGRRV